MTSTNKTALEIARQTYPNHFHIIATDGVHSLKSKSEAKHEIKCLKTLKRGFINIIFK